MEAKSDKYSIGEIIRTSSEIMHEGRIRHEEIYIALKLFIDKNTTTKATARAYLLSMIGIMQSESVNGIAKVSEIAKGEKDILIKSYIQLFEKDEGKQTTSKIKSKTEELTREIEKLSSDKKETNLFYPMEYTLAFNLIKLIQQKLLTKTNDWEYIKQILERISICTKIINTCCKADKIIDKHVKYSLQDRLNKIENRNKVQITRYCGGTLYSWRNLIELTNYKGSLEKRKNINDDKNKKNIVLLTGPGTTGKFDLYLYLAYHRESIVKGGKNFKLYFKDQNSAKDILSLLELNKYVSMTETVEESNENNYIGFLEQYEFQQFINETWV